MRTLKIVVALCALAGFAPAAHAGEVDFAGGILTVTGSGAQNLMFLGANKSNDGGPVDGIDVSDIEDFTITATARSNGCKYEEEASPYHNPADGVSEMNKVRCPFPAAIAVDLGAGDDSLTISRLDNYGLDSSFPIGVTATGGDGNDRFDGSPRADILSGGPGDDSFQGRAGNDRLLGEAGNDLLSGQEGDDTLDGGDGDDRLEDIVGLYPAETDLLGADTYRGGPGNDSVSYFLKTAAVNVTLDSAANDGNSGEGDNVASDVEEVVGGAGNDVLVGDENANSLHGSDGDDQIEGAGGGDTIDGDDGDDRLSGGDGADDIRGDNGNDRIDAGPGEDTVSGDPHCELGRICGGLDAINVRDGAEDLVLCGVERDAVEADSLDNIERAGQHACEDVTIARGPLPPAGEDRASPPSAVSRKVLAKRGFVLPISCTADCVVSVRLLVPKPLAKRLHARGGLLGKARRSLGAGQSSLTVPINKRSRKRLKKVRKLSLTVKGTITSASGVTRFSEKVGVK